MKQTNTMSIAKLCLHVLAIVVVTYFALKVINNDAEAKCAAKHCDRGTPRLIRGDRWDCLCVEVPK
jgi:hypothetical protein